jgi:uncharacterized membrane protein YgcG
MALALLAAALADAAVTQSAFITDEAGLFSQDAIRRVEEQLRSIRERTGKTVRIVTVRAIRPGSTVDQEAQRQFRAEKINGILIFIARRERGIAVQVGRYTALVFGTPERQVLLSILQRRFRAGEYDAGLLEAVAFVGRTLTSAVAPGGIPRAASGSRWSWLVPVLLTVGGVLLVGLVLRRLGASQAAPTAEASTTSSQPAAGPWGGFLGGLLGGLFGSWLGQTLWGAHEIERAAPPAPLPTWQADDALATEGDVGESVTWDDAGSDLPDAGGTDSGQW